MWQPYLNFRLSFIIGKHRKTAAPYYPHVTGAKLKMTFLVCPQLESGMSLSPFDTNVGSILICNEQRKKMRNHFHSFINSVQGFLTKTGWPGPGLPPCTACSKCSSASVNVLFVHVEHREITSCTWQVWLWPVRALSLCWQVAEIELVVRP